ncbi:MAG: GNAT family N-acetyltransferase [Rhizomicrobium sp.]
MKLERGDLDDARVRELLRTHLETAHCNTDEGSAHALDADALKAPGIEVWTAWDGEDLVGIGALKRISPDHGEIKSMHVARARRRTGAGGALLRHLIAVARRDGMRTVSLETSSREYFGPARALYLAHGFAECGPFADYVPDPNSVFMSLVLEPGPSFVDR